MNIFNKTLLAISLAFAIPLSTQANWFGSLTNSILGKKKTLAAGAVLGGTLSYAAVKLVKKLTNLLPPRPTMEEMRKSMPDADESFLQRANEGFDKLDKAKKTTQRSAVVGALCLTAGLIYGAHKLNLFGERIKI